MEQFDERVRLLGISQELCAVNDGLNLHATMIQFNVKAHFAHDINAMPHYRGEQKFGWDITSGISRVVSGKATVDDARQLETRALEEFEREVTTKISKDALRTLFIMRSTGGTGICFFKPSMQE